MTEFLIAMATLLSVLTALVAYASRRHNEKSELILVKQQALSRIADDLLDRYEAIYGQQTVLSDILAGVSGFVEHPRTEHEARVMIENTLRVLVQEISQRRGPVRARVLLYDPNTNRLMPTFACVLPGATRFSGSSFAPGEGAVGQAFLNRSIMHIANVSKDSLFDQGHSSIGRPYQSVLCVPIPHGLAAGITGVLNLDSGEIGEFAQEHILFARSVANTIFILTRHMQASLSS